MTKAKNAAGREASHSSHQSWPAGRAGGDGQWLQPPAWLVQNAGGKGVARGLAHHRCCQVIGVLIAGIRVHRVDVVTSHGGCAACTTYLYATERR
jgi:hypothetical protein